jgi:hypothetical protein
MNNMSNDNGKLRHESMFHSIIEEQFSTATLSMFYCALLVPQNFVRMRYLPHSVQHEKANPAQARRFTNFKSRAARYLQPTRRGPFAVRDFS